MQGCTKLVDCGANHVLVRPSSKHVKPWPINDHGLTGLILQGVIIYNIIPTIENEQSNFNC